jgi:multidrug efflux pump subunit AcrA (membrane-fusion protein)
MIACQSILVISLMACSNETSKQANSYAVPVLVGEVQKVQEYERIFVSGTVSTPVLPADASFLVSGKVVFVGPREGDYVTKDQVLAQIDPTDFRLRLEDAQEQKAKAHAAMEKAVQSARPEVLEQARIAYWRAEDEYRRMKMMYDSNSLAPNDLGAALFERP